jgi:drug/metabolite transporter (DMT)-like permease
VKIRAHTPATAALSDARGSLAARLALVAAALLWSTSGLFAKAPIFDDWGPDVRGPALAFWRAVFAGGLLVPLVRRPRFRPALLVMPLCFAAMNVTYLSAMTFTTAANAIWLQSTAPAWVFLIGVLALGEMVSRRDVMLLVFAALGVGLILCYELPRTGSDSGDSRIGVLLALAAGITYAGVVSFLRALRSEDAVWLVVVNHLVTALVILPYIIHKGLWPTPTQLAVLAAFGLLQMGLPYVLFARALRTVPSQEAAGIVLLEPVLQPLWVYLAWGEPPAWWTLAGAGLILAGLVVRYMPARSSNPRQSL